MHDKEKRNITLYTKRTEITIIKNIEFSSFSKKKKQNKKQNAKIINIFYCHRPHDEQKPYKTNKEKKDEDYNFLFFFKNRSLTKFFDISFLYVHKANLYFSTFFDDIPFVYVE